MIKPLIQITAMQISHLLQTNLVGSDMSILGATTLSSLEPSCVFYMNVMREEYLLLIDGRTDILALVTPEIGLILNVPHLPVKNPRLAFARVLNHFFTPKRLTRVEPSAKTQGATLGDGVYIGNNVVLEEGVVVGSCSTIMHNVVVCSGSKIGENCLIKSNSTIGAKGFGFERDEGGVPISIPHFGGVVIHDNVEVGANNTIVAGTLEPTLVQDNVKLDDHVHIAHNVVVGEGTLIAACAEISGSVKIGSQCWIGPNSSIKDGITIGNNVFVGIGSVVTKSVSDDMAVAGNPARQLVRQSVT